MRKPPPCATIFKMSDSRFELLVAVGAHERAHLDGPTMLELAEFMRRKYKDIRELHLRARRDGLISGSGDIRSTRDHRQRLSREGWQALGLEVPRG